MANLIVVHRVYDGSPVLLNRDQIVWAEDNEDGCSVKLATDETLSLKDKIAYLNKR